MNSERVELSKKLMKLAAEIGVRKSWILRNKYQRKRKDVKKRIADWQKEIISLNNELNIVKTKIRALENEV